jgi:hypothetical protein
VIYLIDGKDYTSCYREFLDAAVSPPQVRPILAPIPQDLLIPISEHHNNQIITRALTKTECHMYLLILESWHLQGLMIA